MYKEDSPDYSAPRDRRFSPHSSASRRISPQPSVQKSRSSEKYWGFRRSRSPTDGCRAIKRERSQEQYRSAEDEQALRSLYCKRCDVELKDSGSMMAHISGGPHLKMKRRLQEKEMRELTGGQYGLSEMLMPSREVYDPDFWNKEKGPKRLRPEQERFLDTKRLDLIPAKFDPKKFNMNERREELYCSDCDVWVKSRNQMQNHKEGAKHLKRTAKVMVFECKLCHVNVPCQDTLNNHMRGKDHIKREKQLMESRKQRGEVPEEEGGYRTGPLEMERLGDTEREELARLRKENDILKRKLKDQAGLRKENDILKRKLKDQRTQIRDLQSQAEAEAEDQRNPRFENDEY